MTSTLAMSPQPAWLARRVPHANWPGIVIGTEPTSVSWAHRCLSTGSSPRVGEPIGPLGLGFQRAMLSRDQESIGIGRFWAVDRGPDERSKLVGRISLGSHFLRSAPRRPRFASNSTAAAFAMPSTRHQHRRQTRRLVRGPRHRVEHERRLGGPGEGEHVVQHTGSGTKTTR